MKRKKLALTTLLCIVIAGGLYIGISLFSNQKEESGLYLNSKENPISYAFNLVEDNGVNNLVKDYTEGWEIYEIEGISFKYPADEMVPEERVGNKVVFKNIDNKDFIDGMRVYVYDASAHNSSMDLLKNYVASELGVPDIDVYENRRINNLEIGIIGDHLIVDSEYYFMTAGIKNKDKGIIFDFGFMSDRSYSDLLDLNEKRNDFTYKIIFSSVKFKDSQLGEKYQLNKPSDFILNEWNRLYPDKSIVL